MQVSVTTRAIMEGFARSTGLTDLSVEPRRYLWTDAFAVFNFLELFRQSGDHDDLQLALQLVDQVHEVLGKHHKESEQQGWLSGLDDEQARRHPTIAGLRIGKKMNERQPNEPFDEQLEWERDGQYFHYLTKWMHALSRVSQVTGRRVYCLWAIELAKTAHSAFVYSQAGNAPKRMYWKMSIDLSHPLVASMGQHDPLDGLITFQQLQSTGRQFSDQPEDLDLKSEIADLMSLCEGQRWATQDSLGIGGLLTDASRVSQLVGLYDWPESVRLEALLTDIKLSLQAYLSQNQLHLPADYRLAFRELGLSIGLHAIARMKKIIDVYPQKFNNRDRLLTLLEALFSFQKLQELIETFWLDPAHRKVNSWLDHADINDVMLATTLAPDGFLSIC